MALDADALVAQYGVTRINRGRPPTYTPEIAAARRKAKNIRTSTAQAIAKTLLTKAYPDDYRALYERVKAEVEATSGPLPGDE